MIYIGPRPCRPSSRPERRVAASSVVRVPVPKQRGRGKVRIWEADRGLNVIGLHGAATGSNEAWCKSPDRRKAADLIVVGVGRMGRRMEDYLIAVVRVRQQ